MTRLNDYRARLQEKYPGYFFPDFDPDDGGAAAHILFLFEKPGPKTAPRNGGSGFVSMDNDDGTAEATWSVIQKARLKRKQIVSWNTIPGWNGTIRLNAAERKAGIGELPSLLAILPRLKSVVLVGKQSHRAKHVFEGRGLKIICSPHPSPVVRAFNRVAWDTIPTLWAQAASHQD